MEGFCEPQDPTSVASNACARGQLERGPTSAAQQQTLRLHLRPHQRQQQQQRQIDLSAARAGARLRHSRPASGQGFASEGSSLRGTRAQLALVQ